MPMLKSFIFCCNILLICLGYSNKVNAQVLRGENITVSVGDEASWTGRNGTGNLSYYGCDRSSNHNSSQSDRQAKNQANCIYLTGGKITCREGICNTQWQNKNYSYVLSSPITEANIDGKIPSTLTIYSDSKLILEEKLYPLPFDNI
jgi:hypothetical protein